MATRWFLCFFSIFSFLFYPISLGFVVLFSWFSLFWDYIDYFPSLHLLAKITFLLPSLFVLFAFRAPFFFLITALFRLFKFLLYSKF